MKTLAIMAIPLSKGLFALVDGEDYDELSNHKWYAQKCGHSFCAVRHIGTHLNRGLAYMHRQLLNAQRGKEVDHKNHCALDNRRQNIRVCTKAQNQHNRISSKNTSSKYKGVFWKKGNSAWCAQICNESKKIHLGLFDYEIEAAKAYDVAAKELFGEFAYTNF